MQKIANILDIQEKQVTKSNLARISETDFHSYLPLLWCQFVCNVAKE